MAYFKSSSNIVGLTALLFSMLMPCSVFAEKQWSQYKSNSQQKSYRGNSAAWHSNARAPYGYSTYKGYADPYGTPLPQQHYPIRPPVNQQSYPYYPSAHDPMRPYPVYPQQNGVTIIYQQQFPTQVEHQHSSSGFVNGQGTLQSSNYMLISDWRHYGLPAPQVGMYWIYQNGRYLQVENANR